MLFQHLDVAFYYLRKKGFVRGITHPYTTTNSFFSVQLGMVHAEWSKHEDKETYDWTRKCGVVTTIVSPKRNKDALLPWIKAQTVYIPVNVNNNHWLLVVVSVPGRTLTVYDSLRCDTEYVHPVISKMAELIPVIMCKRVYDGRSKVYPSSTPFQVVHAGYMPQQLNG